VGLDHADADEKGSGPKTIKSSARPMNSVAVGASVAAAIIQGKYYAFGPETQGVIAFAAAVEMRSARWRV